MSHQELFTVDHQGFYLRGAPFYPLIQENSSPLESWSNAVLIRLPAGLDQDLDWSSAKKIAEEVVSKGKFILWDVDLDLPSFVWIPDDLTSFHSFSLALDQFCSDIFPLFKESTLGVNLYRGKVDFSLQFPRFHWESSFLEGNVDAYSVFCAGLLSDYLHRLVSILPAEVIAFAFFDVEDEPSFSQMARLFLQERFEYISLGLKGAKGPHTGICWGKGVSSQGYCGSIESKTSKREAVVGLFLPEDPLWNSSALEQIEKTVAYLQSSSTNFRTIAEGKLTEQWDGLDQIVVASGSMVSVQTNRKFLGFIAAGGSIVYMDEGK